MDKLTKIFEIKNQYENALEDINLRFEEKYKIKQGLLLP